MGRTPWTCWWSLWFHIRYLSQLGLCSCISWKSLKYLLRTWFPQGFRGNQIEKLWSEVTSLKSSRWTNVLWCLERKKNLCAWQNSLKCTWWPVYDLSLACLFPHFTLQTLTTTWAHQLLCSRIGTQPPLPSPPWLPRDNPCGWVFSISWSLVSYGTITFLISF